MEKIPEKVTDLINANEKQFSIEVSPGLDVNILRELKVPPLFVAVTWHSKTHQCRTLEIPSVRLAEELAKLNYSVVIHLSCDYMRREYCEQLLKKLKAINVRNILVVRGEKFNATTTDFPYAKDLVSYIRNTTGDFFCIGVVAHPDDWEDGKKMQHLKDKVDMGADFIVTQAILDPTIYFNFVNRCRTLKILVKIIPGFFVFHSLNKLKNFAKLCSVKISGEFSKSLESDAFDIPCEEMLKKVIKNSSDGNIMHLFTINKIKYIVEFLEILQE